MKAVLLLLPLALGACAAVPMADPILDRQAKAFQPGPDESAIFLFRDQSLAADSLIPVSIDGRVAGKTAEQTYFLWIVPPGEHRIASHGEPPDELSLRTEAGRTYYVRQEIRLWGLAPRASLQLVDEERGRRGVEVSRRAVDLFATR
jgi:hypothetical protein